MKDVLKLEIGLDCNSRILKSYNEQEREGEQVEENDGTLSHLVSQTSFDHQPITTRVLSK